MSRVQVVVDALQQGVDVAAWKWDLKPSTVERYVRAARQAQRPAACKETPLSAAPVLAIPDTHCPFMHKHAVRFLKDVYEQHGCGEVVHLGDIADFHQISRHISEPDSMGAVDEYEEMLTQVYDITQAFPEATLCHGNHDRIPVRQAKLLGIPQMFMRELGELLKLPSGWTVCDSVIKEGVKYFHGVSAGGVHGAYNAAVRQMMSVVIGHTHTSAGVRYHANDHKLIFGAAGGCLIDIEKYAFEYQKAFTVRPILGCTVVYSHEHAVFVPMDMRRYK